MKHDSALRREMSLTKTCKADQKKAALDCAIEVNRLVAVLFSQKIQQVTQNTNL